mgnify:CR=1 FL=1
MPTKKHYYSPFGRQHAKLHIAHIPTGRTVSFDAYLEGFSDMYTSTWNAEDVYGRMDPIATFINTRRAVSLAWNVPAASYEDAQKNLRELNNLMSFLYPLYTPGGAGGATAINQSPLLRIRFANLLRCAKTGRGLLGYVNGFTFDPDLEAGLFHSTDPTKTTLRDRPNDLIAGGSSVSTPANEYLPKTFRLNCEFNILHEHSLGFEKAGAGNNTFTFRDPNVNDGAYPYYSNATPRYPIDASPDIMALAEKFFLSKGQNNQLGFTPPGTPGPARVPDLSLDQQNLNSARGGAQSVMGGSGAGSSLLLPPVSFKGDK